MAYEIETNIDYFDLSSGYDEETEQSINSKNVKLIIKSKDFFGYCFNYALNDPQCVFKCCEEAYRELECCYKQIDIEEAKKGDIISYHEINDFKSKYEKPCKENCFHFAIIEKTGYTLNSTIIRSKWGKDGIFETTLEDIPDSYGNAIVIWRNYK